MKIANHPLLIWSLFVILGSGGAALTKIADASEPAVRVDELGTDQVAELHRDSHLVYVRLPIDGRSAGQVRLALQQILDSTPNVLRAEERPIVVLEFDNGTGASGEGSSLGACIDLARFISSPAMNRVKTVAYIPGRPRMPSSDVPDLERPGRLAGHAVLVALSTNELAIHPAASLGSAGINETSIDPFVIEAYRNVVARRLTLPVPVAIAMLDRQAELYRVRTGEGILYTSASELASMELAGEILEAETLTTSGLLTEFTGKQLVDFGLIRQGTLSRVALARQLGIPPGSLKAERNQGQSWAPLRIELPSFIDATTLQWITRSLEPRLGSGQTNLLILEFNSVSGDMDSCLLLARRLAACDPNQIRTVAFVNRVAAGPAALLALSCQQVIMHKEASLGGPFESAINPDQLLDLQSAAAGIAEVLEKDPAALQAMIEPTLEVFRFRDKTTGQERLFTNQQRSELPDSRNWLPQGGMDFSQPLTANTAQQILVVRQIVSSWDELKSFYQLEEEPEVLKPSDFDRWLHHAFLFLASPFVAPWLLFLAMFFLFHEFSQPGLGLPGLMGTICLILYFWSQHFGGNANWLEIMLFVAGLAFLLIELLVLPGFGVFGFGGLALIVVSIVLASQTFIFPKTADDFAQLPKSLFALAGAFGGIVVAMFVLRNVLPNTPYFKRLMLDPPTRSEEDLLHGRDPEAMVHWQHLQGRRGAAVTNLIPAGKARIEGQLVDVISDGRLIEKGSEIRVVEVLGNKVVVTEMDS